MHKCFTILTLVFTLGFNITSLANTWSYQDSSWYWLDSSGSPVVGRFADDVGDIYTTDEQGRCLTGVVDGELFGPDCRLQNLSCLGDYEELAQRFRAGETIQLPDKTKLHEFIAYYVRQSSFDRQGKSYQGITYDDEKGCTLARDNVVDKDAIMALFHARFNDISGDTTHDVIVNTTNKVASGSVYEPNMRLGTMQEYAETGRGVCWHYARVLEELLQERGIRAEVVSGIYVGEGHHAWVRAWDGSRWVYSDPTIAMTLGTAYADIPYDVYVREYRVVD